MLVIVLIWNTFHFHVILHCGDQLLGIKLLLIQFLALSHLLCIWGEWLFLVEANMDSRHTTTFLLARDSPWTFNYLRLCLRLLQKLVLRLHHVLFHCLESNLCGIIYRDRHQRTRRPHIRCFAWLISFVSHPAINFGLHFPSNFTLYYSLILFPFQKTLCLAFVRCHLWFTFSFFGFLNLFRFSPSWLCFFIVIYLWLTCHWSLPFNFLGTRFEHSVWKSTLWCLFKSPFLVFLLGLFNGLAWVILLPFLEIFGVLLFGHHFLWVLVVCDSVPLLRFEPSSLWSRWLFAWRFGCILSQCLLDHVFKVVLGRHYLTRLRICLWLLIGVESESRHWFLHLELFLFLLFGSRLNWKIIDYVIDLLLVW